MSAVPGNLEALRPGMSVGEFTALLPSRPLIVEVGAHDGSTTAEFLAHFPRARIVAIEPDPRVIARFKARGFPPGVVLVECAVGDADGEVTFHQSSGTHPVLGVEWDASGSILPPSADLRRNMPWLHFDGQLQVPIRRLDDILAELGLAAATIDLIWADVQGAESDLLRGAGRALERTRCIHLEWSTYEEYVGQASLDALVGMLPGFELVELMRYDALFRSRDPILRRRPLWPAFRAGVLRSPLGLPLRSLRHWLRGRGAR